MTQAIRRDAPDDQARTAPGANGTPRKRSLGMLGIAAIAALGCVLAFAKIGQTQDVKPDDEKIERNAIVHFATLIYREAGSSTDVRVSASILEKLQLVRPDVGSEYWLELFYRGGDYVLQKVDKVVFLRRDSTAQQMKLPVNLVTAQHMGFPFVN